MLFNVGNDPNIETTCDRWYIPERHDVFLYEDVSTNLKVIGINPDFYNPSTGDEFDYNMPSFSCVSASRRKTNQIPNADSEFGCFSGGASWARYVAITPNHVMAIGHYYAVDNTIGTFQRFYGTVGASGQHYQRIQFTKLYKLSEYYGEEYSMFNLPGEIAVLEFNAAEQDTEDGSFDTSLGDSVKAPDVEIKYPYFIPEIFPFFDPLVEYIEGFPGIAFAQDIRGGVVKLEVNYSSYDETSKKYLRIGMGPQPQSSDINDIDNAPLIDPQQKFIDDNLARKEDMSGPYSAVKGNSGTLFFSHIPDMYQYTNNSPIYVSQTYGGNFTNVLQDYIIPGVIEPYDQENGTQYANDMWGRILTRQQMGVPEIGACCEDVGDGTECYHRSEEDCGSIGGTYIGDGVICGTSDPNDIDDWPCSEPEPTGACCDGCEGIDGCQILKQWECESNGLYYRGNFSDCNECIPDEGACCYPDGTTCEWLNECECILEYGELFPNTDCNVVSCTDSAKGACCMTFPYESCIDWETESNCQNSGGTYKGDGVACYDGICDVTGACCITTEGCLDMTQSDCEIVGAYQGDDTTCADAGCIDDGCVYCAGRGSSPRNQIKSHPNKIESNYKKNHINETKDINNYSKVRLPGGECAWMDCSMMKGCPYPPCGDDI